jgi:hypothetical protein
VSITKAHHQMQRKPKVTTTFVLHDRCCLDEKTHVFTACYGPHSFECHKAGNLGIDWMCCHQSGMEGPWQANKRSVRLLTTQPAFAIDPRNPSSSSSTSLSHKVRPPRDCKRRIQGLVSWFSAMLLASTLPIALGSRLRCSTYIRSNARDAIRSVIIGHSNVHSVLPGWILNLARISPFYPFTSKDPRTPCSTDAR